MAAIIPLFEPIEGLQVQAVQVLLPDTREVTADTYIRPRIARYANIPLAMARVESTAGIEVHNPLIGCIRKIELIAGEPGHDQLLGEGILELLEISPLPFFIESFLREIQGGAPCFYVGIPSTVLAVDENVTIDQNTRLGTSSLFYFAAVLQDRVCLEPWGWGPVLGAALAGAGEDSSAWMDFINALYPTADTRLLKVLDHVGTPHPPTNFQITVNGSQQTVSSDSEGLLDLTTTFGQVIELRWLGNLVEGETESLPVVSLYETGNSSNPDNSLLLAEDFNRGHLQVLELSTWLAAPVSSSLARYRTGSRVEPLVDGFKTFHLIATDMISCVPDSGPVDPAEADPPGAHFAGWGFKEFVLDKDLKDENQIPYSYTELVKNLQDNNCDVTALVNQLLKVSGELNDLAQANAVLIALILTGLVLAGGDIIEYDDRGIRFLVAAFILTVLLIEVAGDDLNKTLEDKADESLEMFSKFNSPEHPGTALRSIYPALHLDNPLFSEIEVPVPSPIILTSFVPKVGTWHQKIQLFKRHGDKPDEYNNQYIGYCGGMDMNGNRLDNFGRQGPSAYHDVHVRITGKGVRDLFLSWQERYNYELNELNVLETNPEPTKKVFAVPELDILPSHDQKHILQISRTLFRPALANSEHALDFAPLGDNSINKNMIKAIQAAREYIYIEDQYFIPNESNDPVRRAYLDSLLAAADTCKRLIVLSPSVMSLFAIPFGHERRANVVQKLQDRWGNRALFGAPLRRPVLSVPGGITHEGRFTLYAPVLAADGTIKIGAKARMPANVPFWVWINGELMLVLSLVDEGEIIDGHPVVKANVMRGASSFNPRWGALARDHAKGSAVTSSQLRGIFVHAKTMMVDDTLVCIGSANLNRRGLFSDGEIGVFAVPEQLKAAPDNPARMLRTELWAEQLGLPPSMGASLLHDPVTAFELFRRHFYAGNRFVPLSMFDHNDDLDLQFIISTSLVINVLWSTGMSWLVTHREDIFNTFTDPTTIDDPDHTPGP